MRRVPFQPGQPATRSALQPDLLNSFKLTAYISHTSGQQPSQVIRSLFAVLMNGHGSTARAHVQPQAAAARILLRACAAALTAKSGRDKPTCAMLRRAVQVAFSTLTNHRPNRLPLRVDCKAPHGAADDTQQKPYRAADSWKMHPPPRTPAGYDRWSRTAVSHKKPRRKDL